MRKEILQFTKIYYSLKFCIDWTYHRNIDRSFSSIYNFTQDCNYDFFHVTHKKDKHLFEMWVQIMHIHYCHNIFWSLFSFLKFLKFLRWYGLRYLMKECSFFKDTNVRWKIGPDFDRSIDRCCPCVRLM